MAQLVAWSARLENSLAQVLRLALGCLLVGMIALETTQVVLRYFFALGLPWARDISTITMMWLAWLGAPLLWLKGTHITVDFVPLPTDPRLRKLGRAFLQISMAVSATVLTYYALQAAGRYSTIELPSIPGGHAGLKYYPLVTGSALLFLFSVTALFRKD